MSIEPPAHPVTPGRDETPLRSNIGHLVRVPFQAVVANVAAALARDGLTDIRPAHSSVFQHIHPDGSRLSELAGRAQMTKQSMAYLVNDLVRLGYLERHPDPADGRAVLISLTPRGWDQVASAVQSIERTEAEWAEHLGAERMAQLRELLEELAGHLVDTDQLGAGSVDNAANVSRRAVGS